MPGICKDIIVRRESDCRKDSQTRYNDCPRTSQLGYRKPLPLGNIHLKLRRPVAAELRLNESGLVTCV